MDGSRVVTAAKLLQRYENQYVWWNSTIPGRLSRERSWVRRCSTFLHHRVPFYAFFFSLRAWSGRGRTDGKWREKRLRGRKKKKNSVGNRFPWLQTLTGLLEVTTTWLRPSLIWALRPRSGRRRWLRHPALRENPSLTSTGLFLLKLQNVKLATIR